MTQTLLASFRRAAAAEMESTAAAITRTLADAGLSSLPNAARIQFVQQTSLVVRGIRAGYLINASNPDSSSVLSALAARLPESNREIAILHENVSDALFVVNRTLLLDNLKSRNAPICVKTDDCSIEVRWNSFATSKQSLIHLFMRF